MVWSIFSFYAIYEFMKCRGDLGDSGKISNFAEKFFKNGTKEEGIACIGGRGN